MEKVEATAERKRGRPRDPQVERVVLQATLEELGTNGYAGMSMDGIAARAGVSKPAIYRRWPNKPSLASEAITLLVASEAPLTGHLSTDLAAQLQAAYRNLKVSGGISLIGTILAEIERHPEFLQAYQTSLLQPRRATLHGILEQGRQAGRIRQDADLQAVSLLLIGSILIQDLAGETADGNWAEPIVDLVLRGIAS